MLSFPTSFAAGTDDRFDVRPETIDELHETVACSQTGGYFPVGLYGTWHGGVHLTLGSDPSVPAAPLYACAPGRVVAARLGPGGETALGSACFLLTRHTWRETPFFMLYHHLDPRDPTEAAADLPWLDAETAATLTADGVTGLDAEVRPGDPLWWMGTYGPEPSGDGAPALSDTAQTLLGNHVRARGPVAPQIQLSRGRATHWEVFSADPVLGAGGDPASGDDAPVGAGMGLQGVAPYPTWRTAEDGGNDLAIDSERVREALKPAQDAEQSSWWEWLWGEDYAEITQGEVMRFYLSGAGQRLARTACRFHTEWGLADVESTCQTTGWDAEAVAAMQWWDEAAGVVDDLPRDKRVWHYHPATALRALLAEAQRTAPVFYVEREEGKRRVERPSRLTSDGTVTDVVEENELIYVIGESQDRREIGSGHHYDQRIGVGLSRVDHSNNLHQVLCPKEKLPCDSGVPETITDEERRIWASLWWSEGGLYAINSYDIAFFSFGPFQHTVGKAEQKGELQGILHLIRKKKPKIYNKYFGSFGLKTTGVENQEGIYRGHFELNGETLVTRKQKWKLRDLKWAYRFHRAMRDESLRRLFLEEGFNRLDIVNSLEGTLGKTSEAEKVRLNQVYRTELAKALILDAHINQPNLIDQVWLEAARDVLGPEKRNDVSLISLKDEKEMIERVLTLRTEIGVTSAEARAGMIVLCVEGLDDSLASDIGYESVNGVASRVLDDAPYIVRVSKKGLPPDREKELKMNRLIDKYSHQFLRLG